MEGEREKIEKKVRGGKREQRKRGKDRIVRRGKNRGGECGTVIGKRGNVCNIPLYCVNMSL